MDVRVRRLAAADLEAAWQVSHEAFNSPVDGRERWLSSAVPDRIHGAFADDRLVAICLAHEFGQFFGGRSVPMGGLASVAVAPEERGKGYGPAVVLDSLAAMRDRGEVISSLMPATVRLYRSLGWALAGVIGEQKIATRALTALPAGDAAPLRRATVDDLPAVEALYADVARTRDGMLDRPEWWWRTRVFAHLDRDVVTVVDGGDGLDAYAIWARGDRPVWGHSVEVKEITGRREDAVVALWRMIGAMWTQVPEVTYAGPPEDPLLLLLPEQDDVRTRWAFRWMLRVVDVPGAIEARGWRPGVTATFDLEVRDRHAPWNDGRWRVHVDDGRATVEKGGTGEIRLSVNALASMYSGYVAPSRLAAGGHLVGASARQLGLLDALLAGPTPWLPDFF